MGAQCGAYSGGWGPGNSGAHSSHKLFVDSHSFAARVVVLLRAVRVRGSKCGFRAALTRSTQLRLLVVGGCHGRGILGAKQTDLWGEGKVGAVCESCSWTVRGFGQGGSLKRCESVASSDSGEVCMSGHT